MSSEDRICSDCGMPLSKTMRSDARLCYDCRKKHRAASMKKYFDTHREEQKAYHKERYQWLREKGFCVSCGSEKAMEGRVHCQACHERIEEKKRRRKHG